jgi:FMN-dependent NADH-azoreductase
MNILHVTCSPRGQTSESTRLSNSIVACLLDTQPGATVRERFVGGRAGLPPIDNDYAMSQQASEDVSKKGSAARSEELIRELEGADVVVIGTPVHNFTVPAALKLWIDHVVRVRKTFNVGPAGKVGMLRDRPVFVAVSSGGRFAGEHARQPDYLTPYLETILGMVGLHDLTFFTVQGTAYGAEALAEARATTDRMLQEHFSSFPQREGSTPRRLVAARS